MLLSLALVLACLRLRGHGRIIWGLLHPNLRHQQQRFAFDTWAGRDTAPCPPLVAAVLYGAALGQSNCGRGEE